MVQFEVGMVPLCHQQRVLYVPRLKASTAAISEESSETSMISLRRN